MQRTTRRTWRAEGLRVARWPIRPATSVGLAHGLALHLDCGGAVKRPHSDAQWLVCTECGRRWSDDVINRFTAEDVAARFYVELRNYDPATKVLVWKVDPFTKQRHIAAVPPSDAMAQGLELVPDPTGWGTPQT